MFQANPELEAATFGIDLEFTYKQAWQQLKDCEALLDEKRSVEPEGCDSA